MSVSPAVGAAAGRNDALAVLRQIFEDKPALGIDNQRSWRHFDRQINGAFALLIGAAAR